MESDANINRCVSNALHLPLSGPITHRLAFFFALTTALRLVLLLLIGTLQGGGSRAT